MRPQLGLWWWSFYVMCAMNNANSICGGGAGVKSAILINELGSVGVSRAPRLIEQKNGGVL